MTNKKPAGTVRNEAILLRTSSNVIKAADKFAKSREWSLSQLADIALRKYLADNFVSIDGASTDIASEQRRKHASR